MSNLTKQLQSSMERRTVLLQIRVTPSEKKIVDKICDDMNIRINKLSYELFRYGLDQYLIENPQFVEKIEVDEE